MILQERKFVLKRNESWVKVPCLLASETNSFCWGVSKTWNSFCWERLYEDASKDPDPKRFAQSIDWEYFIQFCFRFQGTKPNGGCPQVPETVRGTNRLMMRRRDDPNRINWSQKIYSTRRSTLSDLLLHLNYWLEIIVWDGSILCTSTNPIPSQKCQEKRSEWQILLIRRIREGISWVQWLIT